MSDNDTIKQYNLTGVERASLDAIEREARRNGRSTVSQMRMIVEQAAARIEARERRAAERQKTTETV